MKKNIGVLGSNTPLGRKLIALPNFVSVDDEYTNKTLKSEDYECVVNCKLSFSLIDWGERYKSEITQTMSTLRYIRNMDNPKVLTVLNAEGCTNNPKKLHTPNDYVSFTLYNTIELFGYKIVKVKSDDYKHDLDNVVDQIVRFAERYDYLPKVSTCKSKSFVARLLGV